MTQSDLQRALEANERRLTTTLDLWIDRTELDGSRSALGQSVRLLCLHRARELYVERARLRRALRTFKHD